MKYDSSNYSPRQEEARAAWFYQVCTHHPPTPRAEGTLTWEDSEAQKREWDKEVGEAYMNEMLEDCPSPNILEGRDEILMAQGEGSQRKAD